MAVQLKMRLGSRARTAGRLLLDGRHHNAESVREALSLLRRLLQVFLQSLWGGCQATWLSFCSLCHVAGSATVSWFLRCDATSRA